MPARFAVRCDERTWPTVRSLPSQHTLMLIAAALWALVLEHAIGPVEAESGPQSVQLCDAEGKCALIESGRLLVQEE